MFDFQNCPLEKKDEFHKAGRAVLRKLAKEMKLTKGSFEIRSNLGGWGILGEVTLHHESFYLQISNSPHGVMYRTCKGRKDFTGGPNLWFPVYRLDDLQDVAFNLKFTLGLKP
jgi:hypothetical protein